MLLLLWLKTISVCTLIHILSIKVVSLLFVPLTQKSKFQKPLYDTCNTYNNTKSRMRLSVRETEIRFRFFVWFGLFFVVVVVVWNERKYKFNNKKKMT